MYTVDMQTQLHGNCSRCGLPLWDDANDCLAEPSCDGLAPGYTEEDWIENWPQSVVPIHQRCRTAEEVEFDQHIEEITRRFGID